MRNAECRMRNSLGRASVCGSYLKSLPHEFRIPNSAIASRMGRFLPPDHSKGDEHTLGGYMAVHARPGEKDRRRRAIGRREVGVGQASRVTAGTRSPAGPAGATLPAPGASSPTCSRRRRRPNAAAPRASPGRAASFPRPTAPPDPAPRPDRRSPPASRAPADRARRPRLGRRRRRLGRVVRLDLR